MANDPVQLYWIYAVFGFLTLIAGFYCILISRNLLRVLIGIEILIKSVTFFLILAGYIGGRAVRDFGKAHLPAGAEAGRRRLRTGGALCRP